MLEPWMLVYACFQICSYVMLRDNNMVMYFASWIGVKNHWMHIPLYWMEIYLEWFGIVVNCKEAWRMTPWFWNFGYVDALVGHDYAKFKYLPHGERFGMD